MAKILVVDDEENQRLLYKQELEDAGYTVDVADSAQGALQYLEKELPDLVVLDIRMPGMDGLEALGQILDRNKDMPVILNTAYANYKENFMSWAAEAYVVKSSDLGELKAQIAEAMQKRGKA